MYRKNGYVMPIWYSDFSVFIYIVKTYLINLNLYYIIYNFKIFKPLYITLDVLVGITFYLYRNM